MQRLQGTIVLTAYDGSESNFFDWGHNENGYSAVPNYSSAERYRPNEPAYTYQQRIVNRELGTKTVLTEDLTDKCSICLEHMLKGSSVRILECTHKFHNKCFAGWDQNSCPECRHVQHSAAKSCD